ncbi:MAG TPA: ribose-5-phosphate isomerase RpiA [Spirochaetia bacterium]|nr:ribose-5-phosphate isomerase RpiA [Spirochaetia bacterium]
MGDLSEVKKRLGTEAVDRFVRDGMRLGLGTGSTAIWAARRVAERLADGSLHGITAVVTSLQTELEARALGMQIVTLNNASLKGELDLTIDGADEVDEAFNLIKGGGGALLMEKVVAYASRRLLIIVDHTKLSSRLCQRFPVPVEIVVDALETVRKSLREMGGEVSLRMAQRKAGPVVTDLGNLLLDVSFPRAFDPAKREKEIKLIPGVLEDGIFAQKTPELLVGAADGSVEHRTKP